MSENLSNSIMGRDGDDLSISGIATYQPWDGMMELKVVILFYLVYIISKCCLLCDTLVIVN